MNDERIIGQMFAGNDGPAYVRRGRNVQQTLETLLARCRTQREEWLEMPRLLLGRLRALAGDWSALRPLLTDDARLVLLQELEATLEPRLRVPVPVATSQRVLRQALGELQESIKIFNRRWSAYLAKVDLTRVNQMREAYNRWYVLEKECAVGLLAAKTGFVRLEPLTTAELQKLLPPLPLV